MQFRRMTAGAAAVLAAVAMVTSLGSLAAPASWAASPGGRARDTTGPSGSVNSFWLADQAGHVWNFGDAPSLGAAAAKPLAHPMVGITPTSDGAGYWQVGSDGGVFSFGDASFHGSTGAIRLARPVVGMAATSDDGGYWLIASDGGVFSFGDASFHGSTGAVRLAQPIVGLVPTADDGGYWLVASDGGVFSFGDAAFHGSTGAVRLAQPIVAMAATPDGGGYWLLAADGGVFSFGDAVYQGSTGANPPPDPAQRIVPTPDGAGYWIIDQNGTSYAYGDAVGTPPVQGLVMRAATAGDRAVLWAFQQLGKPYIWGGDGPVGFDCSGLVFESWLTTGGTRSMPRVANDQYHGAGGSVPMADLAAGDLVFWGSDQADWTSVYHAGMYVGGGRIVESTGDHVQLNSLAQWGLGDLMPSGRRP